VVKLGLPFEKDEPDDGETGTEDDAECRDGHQVGLERQLVPGEQRPRRDREVGAARLTAPSGRLGRATTIVTDLAAATRAHRFAIGTRPSKASEHVFPRLDRTFAPPSRG